MRKLFIGLGMILSCWSYVSAQPDIVALEYYFDSDPGPGGGEVIDLDMEDQDTAVNLKITIPQLTMEGLEEGFHVLVVRFKDSQGDWSVAFTRPFKVGGSTIQKPTPNIVAYEYYFDDDPGPGGAAAEEVPGEYVEIPVEEQGTALNAKVEIPAKTLEDLEPGFHTLVCRTKDSEGDWSVAFTRPIRRVIPPPENQVEPLITAIEYQWMVDGKEVGDPVLLEPDEPVKLVEFLEIADLSLADLDGVTAVLRVTGIDNDGDRGHPAFSEVIIEWLDEENGGVGDGFPDQWEALYEGFSPDVVNDKDADSDDDGLTDFEEFLAMTDPTKPDSDGDGINDYSEVLMAAYGFDPNEDNSDQLENLQNAAFGAGLYSTEVQIKDMNLNRPVIGRDPLTGKIYLKIRVQQSTSLDETDWAQLPLGSEDLSTTGGDIKVTLPDQSGDVYFFRVFTDEDFQ